MFKADWICIIKRVMYVSVVVLVPGVTKLVVVVTSEVVGDALFMSDGEVVKVGPLFDILVGVVILMSVSFVIPFILLLIVLFSLEMAVVMVTFGAFSRFVLLQRFTEFFLLQLLALLQVAEREPDFVSRIILVVMFMVDIFDKLTTSNILEYI